ncbi:nitrilase [Stappia taiwanensis]|uniref:Nitrilase n=1 Tax=Stappia taiwanensis TaxID=992267 RepID=A0A838XT53_9HYPH|nr:nitrilase-related carbon-nitrogen hydrolase [Stappia taiwanensis]MBA4610254.1 nitrilase [Stappia taiwanensis]GGE78072.1 amidohydrolase [Stappia taiwanensis]
MSTNSYSIALCALNLGQGGKTAGDFVAAIARHMGRAREAGARLLVLPEYISECFLAWRPEGLSPDGEIAWMAGEADRILPQLRELVTRTGVSLVAGSMPHAAGEGRFTNRATAFLHDGRTIHHDKLALTPDEQDRDTWDLYPGDAVTLFELDGIRMAMLICLDVEMPALSCLMAAEAPELLLVPSMTSSLAGYSRVFGCAKARAVELMGAVAVCGTVGSTPGTTQNEETVSGAALYLPCEPGLGYDGIGAALPPVDGKGGEEPFLVVDVPIGEIRALRAGGAEVWPGNWRADGVALRKA